MAQTYGQTRLQRSQRTGTHGARETQGKPVCSVPKELVRMEQEKRREYGLGTSNPSTFFDGVVPVIFEQHRWQGPCASTFLHHVLRRRVTKLEQGSHLTHGVAWMIASRELVAPISCILLVMHFQMFQECCPIVQVPDNPRELEVTGSPPGTTTSHIGSQENPDQMLSPGATQPNIHPRGG